MRLIIIFALLLFAVQRMVLCQTTDETAKSPEAQLTYNVRALSELNILDTSDAYPYLSGDGLRLYFTQGDVSNCALYVASRVNTASNFSNQTLVSPLFQQGSLRGCWLNNDETEIYYVQNDNLYYSSRSSLSDPFGAPAIVSLSGNYTGTLYGPSLSLDQLQLFLTINDGNKSIVQFTKTGTLSFTLSDTLNLPIGYSAGPGQLSKNGLKYIVALFNSTMNKTVVCHFTRTTVSDTFNAGTFFQYDNSINDLSYASNNQPSLSADETIVVWVRNACGTIWNDNELFIAQDASAYTATFPNANGCILFPSPARTCITLELAEANEATQCKIYLYSISGQLLWEKTISGKQNTIDVSGLQPGLYYIMTPFGSASFTIAH